MARTLSEFKAKHDPRVIADKLERELEKAQGQLHLQDTIAEALGTAALKLDKLRAPAWALSAPRDANPGVPTLFLSDIHAGEVVEPRQINGVNTYNLHLCDKRMQHTVATAIYLCSLLDRKMRYPGIVVPLGGDMVSGDIHDELVATNELPTIPTVLELHGFLVAAIRTLLTKFPAVFLPCVTGNHGRNTRKPWAKNRTGTSFDWLLYQMLARSFAADKRVTFYIPDGPDALYRIHHTRYLLTHGDQFRGGDSIIGPIGPVFRGTQKKLARNQAVAQDFDVAIMGHWHNYIHTERIIVNGSMKGYDEYAAANNFGFEPPRQALWVTHPRYGINWRMPVLCEQPKAIRAVEWVSIAK